MLFGHNTNVKAGENTFHVQTEDRGAANALIDTTVYIQGRVLHRRTNNYFDLLPLNADTEEALKLRLDDQHNTIIEEIRSGALRLAIPQAPATPKPAETPAASSAKPVSAEPQRILALELINAKTWLTGKRAFLQIAVRDHSANAVEGAKVTARVEGAAEPTAFVAITGSFGHAQIEFDMPRLAGAEPALVIEAVSAGAAGQLRFQLRSRPRVPSGAAS